MADCIQLVKQYHRASRQGKITRDEAARIRQTLAERINNGTADPRLIPFLNRITDPVRTCDGSDRRTRCIHPETHRELYLLYEGLIDSSETMESSSYLIQALQSKSAARGKLKHEFREKLLSEDTEQEHGPDQCGHINTRIFHYKTYAVERHYHRLHPLVEKARSRLVWIANHFPLVRNDEKAVIYKALEDSRKFEWRGGFGCDVTREEIRSCEKVEYIGDHGYW